MRARANSAPRPVTSGRRAAEAVPLLTRAPPPPLQVRAYREATRLVPTDRASLLNLGELLQWLGRTDAANVTYALAVTRGIWAHPQQRPGHYVPRLEARPWWPTDTYRFVATLLRHYRAVRAEGLKLLREAQFDDYKSPALTSGRRNCPEPQPQPQPKPKPQPQPSPLNLHLSPSPRPSL